MKTRLWWLALVVAVLLSSPAAWADGDFYVIAGGGAAVGTKITSVPYEIKNSGFYYLGGNLTSSGSGNAITVNADNVTLDLMGFSLSHSGPLVAGYGIRMSGRYNVAIRNGTVSFFYAGIAEDSFIYGAQHRVSNVRAIYNTYNISLSGKNHLVNACSGSNGTTGIYVETGVITSSVASNNDDSGIQIGRGSIIGNIANNNGTAGFLFGDGIIMVDRNSAADNGANYSGGGAS
ncbi:MAG TPA: hypothetical protein VIN67_09640, partial [Desulfobaccales bacterium]